MDGSGGAREGRVVGAFVELADTLVDDYDVVDLLSQLAAHAVDLLAAEGAGIVLADASRHLRVVAASGDDAELMELLQLQHDEGPCRDCVRTAVPVTAPDLAQARHRWPAFVDAALEKGRFRSVHALPLRLRGESIGALNLFHGAAGELPAADVALGQALADVATIGILHERALRRAEVLAEQLQGALTSRVVIEQAKGVLAQEAGIDVDAAFVRLRRHARSTNVRLSDVARRVVDGDLHPDLLHGTA